MHLVFYRTTTNSNSNLKRYIYEYIKALLNCHVYCTSKTVGADLQWVAIVNALVAPLHATVGHHSSHSNETTSVGRRASAEAEAIKAFMLRGGCTMVYLKLLVPGTMGCVRKDI